MSATKIQREVIIEHLKELRELMDETEEICKNKFLYSDDEVNQFFKEDFFRKIDYECDMIKHYLISKGE